MKTRHSKYTLHLALAQMSELSLKTYAHKAFIKVFLRSHVVLYQGLKHEGRIWPARLFCAARDAFWEISSN